MISNVNSSAIVMSSICEPLAIVTSRWSIILMLYLWTLSSSQWRCQPGRFSMTTYRHDRRGICRCALLRFRGRIEIDLIYTFCFVEPASAAASGRATAGSTRAVPGVSAQTTPAQTVSWSIPIPSSYSISVFPIDTWRISSEILLNVCCLHIWPRHPDSCMPQDEKLVENKHHDS